MPRLTHQLHRGLEEVNVQPYIGIKPFQTLIRRFRSISVIAHQAAHHITVLLLYVAAIVLLVGPGARKGNLLPLAIGKKMPVNEFAAVIGVQS